MSADRQTNSQAGRQAGRQADRQTGSQTDSGTHAHILLIARTAPVGTLFLPALIFYQLLKIENIPQFVFSNQELLPNQKTTTNMYANGNICVTIL